MMLIASATAEDAHHAKAAAEISAASFIRASYAPRVSKLARTAIASMPHFVRGRGSFSQVRTRNLEDALRKIAKSPCSAADPG
jgi:hypothetical protein